MSRENSHPSLELSSGTNALNDLEHVPSPLWVSVSTLATVRRSVRGDSAGSLKNVPGPRLLRGRISVVTERCTSQGYSGIR